MDSRRCPYLSRILKAALQLVNEQLGERPVKGIIITHSHADHFAGILGIFNAEEPATKELPL